MILIKNKALFVFLILGLFLIKSLPNFCKGATSFAGIVFDCFTDLSCKVIVCLPLRQFETE